MDSFQHALAGIARIPRFFLWRLEFDATAAKYAKRPCALDGSPFPVDASQNWTDYATAQTALANLPRSGQVCYALGWWLAADCPYWFLDADHAAVNGKWTPFAEQLVAAYPGAFCEVSASGNGLHILGTADIPAHRNKPPREVASLLLPAALELYSQDRGICFSLNQQAQGCADTRCDLQPLVTHYFPPHAEREGSGGMRPEYRGPYDDDILIQKMLAARVSAQAAFNGKASLPQLWRGEVSKDSDADMSLAAHVAWWCGADPERVERLMRRSGLTRPKWDDSRPGGTYLSVTVRKACELCESCYIEPDNDSGRELGAANLTTELANAYRLKAAHGDNMMAVPGIGWHVWGESGPWTQDDHAAYRLAFGLGVAIKTEADALDDWVYQATLDGLGLDECKRRADIQKNRRNWAKASESKAVIDHSLSLAERLLSVPADKLDASPLLIGCPSGVIDLTTCTMREHRRDDYISKRIACDYDPAARAPIWERFIAEIMGSDVELISYLQTLCGYILSGVRGEHLLVIMYGQGSNGKSSFLTALQNLMGDYAGTGAPGLLIARGGSEHPTGLAALQGRRLIVVSETGESGRLNEDQVKQLTGGDRITARKMRQDFFEFDSTHQIVCQTNHKPRVTGSDAGIWRRLKLVPFTVTVSPERRDTKLPEKLAAEFPGVLAWAIEGWKLYQAQGLREPAAVRNATAEYRSASDQIGQFIEERCVVGADHAVSSSGLYIAYRIWCAENGEYPMTNKAFSLRVAERGGIVKTKQPSGMFWRGLGIAPHVVSGPFLSVVK